MSAGDFYGPLPNCLEIELPEDIRDLCRKLGLNKEYLEWLMENSGTGKIDHQQLNVGLQTLVMWMWEAQLTANRLADYAERGQA